MTTDSKVHHFHHECKDGTRMSLAVDISSDLIKVTSNFDASKRPDLGAEFLPWVDSAVLEVLPLLSEKQVMVLAVRGLQKIAENMP